MKSGQPPFTDFLARQRPSARGYTCPVCEKIYYQEPKIWAHGRTKHPDYLGDLASTELAEDARKRFRQTALDTTYAESFLKLASADVVTFRQDKATVSGKATSAAAADSNPEPKASGRKIGGEEVKSTYPARLASTPGNLQGPEKKIDDFKNLSLEQVRSKEQRDRHVLVNNSRKRGPDVEPEVPVPHVEGFNGAPMNTRPRHDNAGPGGRASEITRQGIPPGDLEYRRDSSGPKQTLYDPNIDSTNTQKGFRRESQHGRTSSMRWRNSSKEVTSPDRGLRSIEKDNVKSDAQTGHERSPRERALFDTDEQGRQSHRSERNQERDGSESPEDDLPGGDLQEGLDSDPEMLLQPETRPISHEQLVVEVKGIYAGLVMVEAKCIDIDERQSAAAQEKDPSKRSELKNDQWQSLIALHKQVYRLCKMNDYRTHPFLLLITRYLVTS